MNFMKFTLPHQQQQHYKGGGGEGDAAQVCFFFS
jgi:hypothetical protein